MKQYFTLCFLIPLAYGYAQTEFIKNSIHLFFWDHANNNWLNNTRKYLTYFNGSTKETDLKRQRLRARNRVNLNSGWSDKYKYVYSFASNNNKTLHWYSLNSGPWQSCLKEINTCIDNYLH